MHSKFGIAGLCIMKSRYYFIRTTKKLFFDNPVQGYSSPYEIPTVFCFFTRYCINENFTHYI